MSTASTAWRWHHTSLAVTDIDQAVAFYQAAFGYEVLLLEREMTDRIQRIVGLAGLRCDLAQLRSPLSGHVLELIAFHDVPAGKETHGPTRAGAAHVAFQVQDLDRALREVQRHGAALIGEITRFPEGRCAYCREPSGTVFELQEAPPDDAISQTGGQAT
jgi:predicted enzyme related to lactoylglutathione lyase